MTRSAERALIEYRLGAARDALRDAELLLEHQRYRAAVNRIYYAGFYAAVAVLLSKDLRFSKHSGVISAFDREFIKTNIFPAAYSKSLHRAFHERQEDDYMPFVEFDEAEIHDLYEGIQDMVRGIKDYLSTVLSTN